MKIGIIGHFGGNNNFLNGQTIKTKEINDYIESYYNIKTDKFDTYKNAKNPFKLIFNILKILKHNEIIIVVLYTRGYKIIAPLIVFLNKFYKRRLFDFAVGGKRYNIYKNNNYITKVTNKFERVYVEIDKIKEEYIKRNINNVDVINNFKILEKGKFNKTNKNKIKLCIFSRILKEKGIKEAIDSVTLANKKIGKDIFILDIYGQIDLAYEKEFKNLIDNSPKYINYKNKIDYDKSVKILNNYDILLFLSYYKNEGFPGTIIDSFYSGLSVIASDWNYNFCVLDEGYTGIKVDVKNINDISDKLIYLYNNISLIDKMKKNSLKESEKYIPDKVMKKFIYRLNGDEK